MGLKKAQGGIFSEAPSDVIFIKSKIIRDCSCIIPFPPPQSCLSQTNHHQFLQLVWVSGFQYLPHPGHSLLPVKFWEWNTAVYLYSDSQDIEIWEHWTVTPHVIKEICLHKCLLRFTLAFSETASPHLPMLDRESTKSLCVFHTVFLHKPSNESASVGLNSGKHSRDVKWNVLLIRSLTIERTDWLWTMLPPKSLVYETQGWVMWHPELYVQTDERMDETDSHLKMADGNSENEKASSKHRYKPPIRLLFFRKSPAGVSFNYGASAQITRNPKGSGPLRVGVVWKESFQKEV